MELLQREIDLVIMVYDVTADFIGDEKFGLIFSDEKSHSIHTGKYS